VPCCRYSSGFPRLPVSAVEAFVDFVADDSLTAYYAARDQDERGKESLRRVNGKVEGYDVEIEYAIVKNTILEERRELYARRLDDHSFKQLLCSYVECFKGPNARRTLGAALPVCAQQLTGLSFLNTYSSLFFKQSGFSNAFLVTTILSKLPGF
jgi:MFS transporter, SP family, sugar:H+ symporter